MPGAAGVEPVPLHEWEEAEALEARDRNAAVMTGPAIVADTTSYLPPELTERHGVQLVSLYVGIEGKQ